MWSRIDAHVAAIISQGISCREALQLRLVCRNWNDIFMSDAIWSILCMYVLILTVRRVWSVKGNLQTYQNYFTEWGLYEPVYAVVYTLWQRLVVQLERLFQLSVRELFRPGYTKKEMHALTEASGKLGLELHSGPLPLDYELCLRLAGPQRLRTPFFGALMYYDVGPVL